MSIVMTEIKPINNAREIADEIGMSYERFVYRCTTKGLSADTAKAEWNKKDAERERGFFKTTKNIIADILHRPVSEIFPDA